MGSSDIVALTLDTPITGSLSLSKSISVTVPPIWKPSSAIAVTKNLFGCVDGSTSLNIWLIVGANTISLASQTKASSLTFIGNSENEIF